MKGFRVYDKDAGKYVTDELYWVVDSDGNLKSVEDGDLIKYPSCVIEYDTGLKDKNGKKIFEGDILKNFKCFGSTSGVVVFNEGGFEIKGLTPNSPETICYGFWQVKPNIAVIGNIHDNPELLEENSNENN